MKSNDSRAGSGIDPRTPDLSLLAAMRYFMTRPSAIGLVTLLLVAIGARVWIAAFSVWDALLCAVLVAVHPLTEWMIHVGLLHFRPRRWGRFLVDFEVSRDHRAHHAEPHDPKWWFMPLRSACVGVVIIATVSFGLLPTPLAATVMVAMLGLGAAYEWTHYLCHSSWRPRSKWYRRIWRLHRLHHFKNENYWMGVTMHAADRLLGTLPEVDEVETSPTCRNLNLRP